VGLFNEKDMMDGSKRMVLNWEVILTPFLSQAGRKILSRTNKKVYAAEVSKADFF